MTKFLPTMLWREIEDNMVRQKCLKVVMVDDDPEDIFIIERAFNKAQLNIDFMTLSGGKELIDLLSDGEHRPDCILMDINMSGMNGYDVLRWLRKTEEYQQMHVLMLTTSSLPADASKASKLGANALFTKPVSLTETNDLVENLCNYFERKILQKVSG